MLDYFVIDESIFFSFDYITFSWKFSIIINYTTNNAFRTKNQCANKILQLFYIVLQKLISTQIIINDS